MAERKHRLNPIVKVFLEGIYDENSELSKLNGLWHIKRKIWRYVTSFWKSNIKINKTLDPKVRNLDAEQSYINLNANTCRHKGVKEAVYYRRWPYSYYEVNFPKPTGININMMPFIMNLRDFSKCRLPDYLRPYWEAILCHCPVEYEQRGKIGYLTIQESYVRKDYSQRRPGLHTEKPGLVRLKSNKEKVICNSPCDDDSQEVEDTTGFGNGYSLVRRFSYQWGSGSWRRVSEQPQIVGGIYMASNLSHSCKIYNCEIMDDTLIGEHGDIEHLREFLPEGEDLKKNSMYWFTDRTPHESLPLKNSAERQFFRLVTSEVSLWFEEHSTKNPLGVVPDPEKTKIVKGYKFDKNGVEIWTLC